MPPVSGAVFTFLFPRISRGSPPIQGARRSSRGEHSPFRTERPSKSSDLGLSTFPRSSPAGRNGALRGENSPAWGAWAVADGMVDHETSPVHPSLFPWIRIQPGITWYHLVPQKKTHACTRLLQFRRSSNPFPHLKHRLSPPHLAQRLVAPAEGAPALLLRWRLSEPHDRPRGRHRGGEVLLAALRGGRIGREPQSRATET